MEQESQLKGDATNQRESILQRVLDPNLLSRSEGQGSPNAVQAIFAVFLAVFCFVLVMLIMVMSTSKNLDLLWLLLPFLVGILIIVVYLGLKIRRQPRSTVQTEDAILKDYSVCLDETAVNRCNLFLTKAELILKRWDYVEEGYTNFKRIINAFPEITRQESDGSIKIPLNQIASLEKKDASFKKRLLLGGRRPLVIRFKQGGELTLFLRFADKWVSEIKRLKD